MISVELRFPEFDATLWHTTTRVTIMPVPIAAVDKNDLLQIVEGQVRSAGKVVPVEAEAMAQHSADGSNQKLWLGVTIADTRHNPTASFRR